MIRRGAFSLFVAVILALVPMDVQATDRVVAAHYPPLMITAEGERPGYAIEVLQEAARRAGRDIELTFLPFERAIFALKSEPATLMPALFHGKPDGHKFLWLEEIHRARLVFGTVTGRIDDLETARGLSAIVLEAGTTGDALLTKMGFTNLVRVHAPEASAQMLASGRADAWLLTKGLIQQVWDEEALEEPLYFGDTVHEVATCLVSSASLPDAVSQGYRGAVRSMKEDGTLSALLERYDLE